MTLKVGINGYGRIGRNVLRALYEAGRQKEIRIVAVNDLGDAETNAYLTRHDTVHGRFRGEVRVDGDHMVVNGDRIRVLAERDPSKLPVGRARRRHRVRVHRPLHQQGEGGTAPGRRREARDHLGAGREGRGRRRSSTASTTRCSSPA